MLGFFQGSHSIYSRMTVCIYICTDSSGLEVLGGRMVLPHPQSSDQQSSNPLEARISSTIAAPVALGQGFCELELGVQGTGIHSGSLRKALAFLVEDHGPQAVHQLLYFWTFSQLRLLHLISLHWYTMSLQKEDSDFMSFSKQPLHAERRDLVLPRSTRTRHKA